MSTLNQATLIGNLGENPVIRYTQDNRPIASLSIATSDKWTDKTTGAKKERTEWHRVSVFNEGLCRIIEQYVRKGSRVLVQGKLQTRKWTDDSGVDRYSTEITLQPFESKLVLLGGPKANGEGNGVETQPELSGTSTAMGHNPEAVDRDNGLDDDIPF